MSSILEEAVIHANTLREAAIKNAEQIVIEKYSSDIKDAVEKLLEGTEDIMESVPFAHEELLTTEEKKGEVKLPVKDVTGKEELNEEIDIDLEQIKALLSESEDDEIDLSFQSDDDDEPTAKMTHDDEEPESIETDEPDWSMFDIDTTNYDLDEDQAGGSYEEEEEVALEEENQEEIELEEEVPDFQHIAYRDEEEEVNLEEAIQFDTRVTPTGWLGVNQYHLEEAELIDAVSRIAKESMKKYDEENKKERAKLQKENDALKEKVNQLDENNKKLNKVVQSLKDKLVESNVTNGKLFYTNCVLKDPSLNERQKEKLVENLSNAQSLEQAKVIYETLNSVGSTNSSIQKPKSLSEAINRNSSLVVSPRRTEERKETDPVSDRWKRLAGI